MTPFEVNHDNILTDYSNIKDRRLKRKQKNKHKSLHKVGNYVRITKYKHVFEKKLHEQLEGRNLQDNRCYNEML